MLAANGADFSLENSIPHTLSAMYRLRVLVGKNVIVTERSNVPPRTYVWVEQSVGLPARHGDTTAARRPGGLYHLLEVILPYSGDVGSGNLTGSVQF